MACGSCGGSRARTDYEVTFRDGSKNVFGTVAEARMAVAADTSTGLRSATYRAVPKTSK